MSSCISMTVDKGENQYFATGGTDSLIAVWNMNSMTVKRTITNNDYKVITLDNSFDGQFIAGLFEDDINKKYYVEIYDVSFSDSESMPGTGGKTLYSQGMSQAKNCLAWHPKKHILAYAGEDRNEGSIVLLHPG